jgi:glycosyltransferase involved in cell wall biosynthesis
VEPKSAITILKDARIRPRAEDSAVVARFEEIKSSLARGRIFQFLLRYDEASLLARDLRFLQKPFLSALLTRLVGRRRGYLKDESGRCEAVDLGLLCSMLARLARDARRISSFLSGLDAELRRLESELGGSGLGPLPSRGGRPAYLRTDLVGGLVAGGSVAHTAGILNNLGAFCGPPIFLTTDVLPLLDPAIEIAVITPSDDFADFRELPALAFTGRFAEEAERCLHGKDLAFLYQRYCVGNFSGVKLARARGTPLVLEYNGSEVWVGRNWGKRLKYESLADRIERLNLLGADLVVVVSDVLRDEVVRRGVPAHRVLVNPNGVDPDRYSPDVDGTRTRRRLGLDGKLVIGFIGTFGAWHGAEVLAEAFARLLAGNPGYRHRTRLLLVGDGPRMPLVKEVLKRLGAAEQAVLTGLVPQDEGPAHLAACDVLVASHVSNADGSRFFGSPTKLFEYMAMGKGIVASALEQIGEVLEHQRTAWLVRPGDVSALRDGLRALIDAPDLRERLGRAAREEVLRRYTWREHTHRIVDRIVLASSASGASTGRVAS